MTEKEQINISGHVINFLNQVFDPATEADDVAENALILVRDIMDDNAQIRGDVEKFFTYNGNVSDFNAIWDLGADEDVYEEDGEDWE
jgi:hypothetical protein